MLKEIFRSDVDTLLDENPDAEILHAIRVFEGDPGVNKTIEQLIAPYSRIAVSALVRNNNRVKDPESDIRLTSDDVLVVLGPQSEIDSLQLEMTGIEPTRGA